jgi:type VI secretion system lysozyme-like protein
MRAKDRVAPTPLFDKLISREPDDPVEKRRLAALDQTGLRISIRRELSRILNSRTRLKPGHVHVEGRTVADFGIADRTDLNPQSLADRETLARDIEAAIRAYEPRLRAPSVKVLEPEEHQQGLYIYVEGRLAQFNVKEPLMFQLIGGRVKEVAPDGG